MQYHLKKLTLLLPECVPQPANPLAPPISVVLAGAGVCNGPSAPTRTCSQEKSEPPIASAPANIRPQEQIRLPEAHLL